MKQVRKKRMLFPAAVLLLCLLPACGGESEPAAESSAPETTAAEAEPAAGQQTTKSAGTAPSAGQKLTVPGTAVLPDPEITALKLNYTAEGPLTLDLNEKIGPFAAHVDASGYVTKDMLHFCIEDAALAEVSDVTIKDGGLVNFYLTGKQAGTGSLYLAAADGSLQSDPVELKVRSAEEQEQAERSVYYTAIGEYWHYSEDCAREDYPGTTYDWEGNAHEVDRSGIRVMESKQGMVIGDKKPCPKCAGGEDGEG